MIDMSIVLGILIELRENEQVAAYVISHTQRWKEPYLSWNPANHNNVKEIVVPVSMIWLPKLFVYNSMNTQDMLTEDKYDARIKSDGSIKLNVPQYVTCICRLSIEQFPFDTQFCAIALASPLLTVEEMDVRTTQPPVDSYFAGNSEWSLTNVTVRHMKFLEESEYRAEIHYIFEIKRRPIFYITVIVVPIFLISALSILGIFTPGEKDSPRNEKVSMGLGSLMATTVLLGIVAGAMPKSNSLPLLGYYILSVIILCAVAVGLSIIFLTVSRKLVSKGRIPSAFTYRLFLLRPQNFSTKRLSCASRFSVASIKIVPNGKKTSYSMLNGNNTGGFRSSINRKSIASNNDEFDFDDLAKISQAVGLLVESQVFIRRKIEKEQTKTLIEREWSRVFTRMDILSLIIFQSLNIMSLIFFLQFAWAPAPPMRDQLV
uniref:Uncharacterized protein n=1 Tax=Panagrolaimus sp. ES5 TaxID=591445 RepID=A0AC34F9T7_9BILA